MPDAADPLARALEEARPEWFPEEVEEFRLELAALGYEVRPICTTCTALHSVRSASGMPIHQAAEAHRACRDCGADVDHRLDREWHRLGNADHAWRPIEQAAEAADRLNLPSAGEARATPFSSAAADLAEPTETDPYRVGVAMHNMLESMEQAAEAADREAVCCTECGELVQNRVHSESQLGAYHQAVIPQAAEANPGPEKERSEGNGGLQFGVDGPRATSAAAAPLDVEALAAALQALCDGPRRIQIVENDVEGMGSLVWPNEYADLLAAAYAAAKEAKG